MVTTRAQAKALIGNGTRTASQPRHYESEEDSGFEPEGEDDDEYRPPAVSRLQSTSTDRSEDGDGADEDEMMTVQIPNLVPATGQNITSPRPWLPTGDDYSPSSDQPARVLQLIEPPDDAHTTATHEVIMPRYWPSNQLTFFEEQHESGPPSYKDLLWLEFYQTFPHDPAATLCKHHFLPLAERWFQRRQGHTEQTFYNLSQKFPYGRVENLLDYTRDRDILKQFIWDEKWRQMPHEEFMEILRAWLHCAEVELRERRRVAIVRTGKRPRCALESCGKLSCGYCLAWKNDGGDLYYLVREAKAKGMHGEWREEDLAAMKEYERSGVEEEGERADIRPEYVSVGGLHFIVDVCNGETVIRFQ